MDDPVTVLAVDDQSVNLRLLDAVLTPRGHRVISASSGAEALALLESEDVDLVLSDLDPNGHRARGMTKRVLDEVGDDPLETAGADRDHRRLSRQL